LDKILVLKDRRFLDGNPVIFTACPLNRTLL